MRVEQNLCSTRNKIFFSTTLEIYVDGLSLSKIVNPVISFAF